MWFDLFLHGASTHITAMSETELQMVQRHVRQAKMHIARQENLIESLARDGHPTDLAKDLLQLFRRNLKAHSEHLETIQAELRDARGQQPKNFLEAFQKQLRGQDQN